MRGDKLAAIFAEKKALWLGLKAGLREGKGEGEWEWGAAKKKKTLSAGSLKV